MGYPHHRLPQIYFTSNSLISAHNSSLSQESAKKNVRRRFSFILIQERFKRRLKIRRRRLRKSRSSSSAAMAQKRDTVRAQQHIEVFGWDTPQAEVATRPSRATLVLQNLNSPSAGAKVGPPSDASPENTVTRSTITDSHDGAGASVARKTKITGQEKLHHLKHAVEDPVYWRSTKAQDHLTSWVATGRDEASPFWNPGRESHFKLSRTAIGQRACYIPRDIGRNQTSDLRIDPKKVSEVLRMETSGASWSVDSHLCQEKSPEAATPPSQTIRSRVSALSMESAVQTVISNAPSQTPSQSKALRQFKKGLELYVQATASLPKRSLIPSSSVTTVSANTVKELKPYQAELKAAGLAVTSDEQLRKSIFVTKRRIPTPPTTPPITPPKDEKWLFKETPGRTSKEPRVPNREPHNSEISSSRMTAMDWTPPHQTANQQQSLDNTPYTMSSDYTVMELIPLHEEPAQAKLSPPTYTTASKRSLPWLRQIGSPPSGSIFPPAFTKTSTSALPIKTASPSEATVAFSSISNSSSTPKEEINRANEIKNCPGTQVKLTDSDNASQRVFKSLLDRKTEVPTDTAVKTSGETAEDVRNININGYAKNQTQTVIVQPEAVPLALRRAIIEDRTQVIGGRSTAFRVTPSKHTNPSIPAAVRRFKDRTTQTETVYEPPTFIRSRYIKKNDDLKLALKHIHRSRTFQLTSGSLGGISPLPPFPQSMAFCSQRKSFEQDKIERSKDFDESLQSTMQSHAREASVSRRQAKSHSDPGPTSDSPFFPSSLTRYIEAESCPPALEPEPSKNMPLLLTTLHASSDTKSGLTHKCYAPGEQYLPSLDEFPTGLTPDRKLAKDQSNELCICEVSESEATRNCSTFDNRSIPDPMKKPPFPRLRPQQIYPTQAHTKQNNAKRPLPSIPMILDSCPSSESATTSVTDCKIPVGSKVSDKDVFLGLHVATAAACDEDVDMWIEEITGSGVRKFLADLSAFDGLGVNALATVAKRAAKQRRNQVRAWEKIRKKKILETTGGLNGKGEEVLEKVETKQGYQTDKKIGLIAGDG